MPQENESGRPKYRANLMRKMPQKNRITGRRMEDGDILNPDRSFWKRDWQNGHQICMRILLLFILMFPLNVLAVDNIMINSDIKEIKLPIPVMTAVYSCNQDGTLALT